MILNLEIVCLQPLTHIIISNTISNTQSIIYFPLLISTPLNTLSPPCYFVHYLPCSTHNIQCIINHPSPVFSQNPTLSNPIKYFQIFKNPNTPFNIHQILLDFKFNQIHKQTLPKSGWCIYTEKVNCIGEKKIDVHEPWHTASNLYSRVPENVGSKSCKIKNKKAYV